MKNLAREINFDLQFLFPCIATTEDLTGNDLTIMTETDLSRLYPIKMSVAGMTFVGEDYWGRPSFKDEKDQYFCELDGVLYFKGKDMEGEPNYPVRDEIVYENSNVDIGLSEFKPFVEKVIKYAAEKENVELLSTTYSLRKDPKGKHHKIVGLFKFKLS